MEKYNKKNITFKVTEKCQVSYINEYEYEENDDNEYKEKYFALIHYLYDTKKDTFEKAIIDFAFKFDIDNVYDCHDEFDGECLDSEVIKVEVV